MVDIQRHRAACKAVEIKIPRTLAREGDGLCGTDFIGAPDEVSKR